MENNNIEIMTLSDFLEYFGLGIDYIGDSMTIIDEDGMEGDAYPCSTDGIIQILSDYEALISPVFEEAAGLINFDDYDESEHEEVLSLSIEALDENTLDEYKEEQLTDLIQIMNSAINPESMELE